MAAVRLLAKQDLIMLKLTVTIALIAAFAAAPTFVNAAEGEARSMTGWPKPSRSVGPGEKLCKMKFGDGEHTVWVCKKEEPCCEWELLNKYVKCGSTMTGCL
ncbi:MAG: hypothetical protein ACKVP4_06395 [Hyphomicrobium sp.]